jgi:hypothetical protein
LASHRRLFDRIERLTSDLQIRLAFAAREGREIPNMVTLGQSG